MIQREEHAKQHNCSTIGNTVLISVPRPSDKSMILTEEEGFEPPARFPVQRFSRPPVSTTHPFLRVLSYLTSSSRGYCNGIVLRGLG
jgi:hypothetical protein